MVAAIICLWPYYTYNDTILTGLGEGEPDAVTAGIAVADSYVTPTGYTVVIMQ